MVVIQFIPMIKMAVNEITFIGQLPFITAQKNRQQCGVYQKVKGISYG